MPSRTDVTVRRSHLPKNACGKEHRVSVTLFLHGHVNTIEIVAPGDSGRRPRRKHSPQFKAAVVAACCKPGVSIASVALANGLNANLLRRWVYAQERSGLSVSPSPTENAKSAAAPQEQFISITIDASSLARESIKIELRHEATVVNIAWPVSAAAACAQWLRTLLR